MPLLPQGTLPFKKLSNPHYASQQKLPFAGIVQLYQQVNHTLSQIHNQGIVVGDLNDHNLVFHPDTLTGTAPANTLPAYWIDVDSYQFDGYPCSVALETFLDPCLYHAGDLSARPVFSQGNDWYAYLVLLVKGLLGVHPYGGVLSGYNSLRQRAEEAKSILTPCLIYPGSARPLETLSDELLNHIHTVFDKRQRPPFPASLLNTFAASLVTCSHCGLSYSSQRRGCPGCSSRTQVTLPANSTATDACVVTTIYQGEGDIRHLTVLPTGRILFIVQKDDGYFLVQAGAGGILSQQFLFRGHTSYSFQFIGMTLAVGDGDGSLLVLQLDPLKQLARLETGLFLGLPVVAASGAALYRLAGGYIMRGQVGTAGFVEGIVGDARLKQTMLWGAGRGERIAGMYRLLDQHRFFLVDDTGRINAIEGALLPPKSRLLDVQPVFGHSSIMLQLHYRLGARLETRLAAVDAHRGAIASIATYDTLDAPHWERLAGKALSRRGALLIPSDSGVLRHEDGISHPIPGTAAHVSAADRLHLHPAGLLVQKENALLLLK
jgi:hypothetical protein